MPPGRQVQLGVERYVKPDDDCPVVVAGDFNHNVLWDGPRPGPRSMRDCIDVLEGHGLVSAYHSFREEAHGEETSPTHYWEAQGGAVNTYHIDYCWVPKSWSIARVEVGARADWYDTKIADHSPIVCDLRIPLPC